jgi:hypothetical protein
MLHRIENKELPYNSFAYREFRSGDDMCVLHVARAFLVHLTSEGQVVDNQQIIDETDQNSTVPVCCIELVGNRFLRRMVRNIAV